MRGKLLKDLSANTIQVVLSQLAALVIFYITSRYLDKQLFGEMNWAIAVAVLIISVISLGIDMMVIRRIAQGHDQRQTVGLHLVHVIGSSSIIMMLIIVSFFFVPSAWQQHFIVPGIILSQLLSFCSFPFKQLANGSRHFRALAIMNVISNMVKALLLVIFLFEGLLTPMIIVIIFMAGSIAEVGTSIYLTIRKISGSLFPVYWNKQQYQLLIKDSLPQYGVSLFNILLARFDWIMLGILTTTVITAEYSFAYKAVELARLPLLIISPILIPVFAKMFVPGHAIDSNTKDRLALLFRIEMIIAVLIPLVLACCWVPLVDGVTAGKYGAVNEGTFLVLAACVPLQYATDYCWNLAFSQNHLGLNFSVSAISAVGNIILNLILIPFIGAWGAAIAYTISFGIQLLIYHNYLPAKSSKPDLFLLIKSLAAAITAVAIIKFFNLPAGIAVIAGLTIYCLLGWVTGLLRMEIIKPAYKLLSAK
jgi:O-antigen/teichoic acid export membrane protein